MANLRHPSQMKARALAALVKMPWKLRSPSHPQAMNIHEAGFESLKSAQTSARLAHSFTHMWGHGANGGKVRLVYDCPCSLEPNQRGSHAPNRSSLAVCGCSVSCIYETLQPRTASCCDRICRSSLDKLDSIHLLFYFSCELHAMQVDATDIYRSTVNATIALENTLQNQNTN